MEEREDWQNHSGLPVGAFVVTFECTDLNHMLKPHRAPPYIYTALCSFHSEKYTHCSINPQKTH